MIRGLELLAPMLLRHSLFRGLESPASVLRSCSVPLPECLEESSHEQVCLTVAQHRLYALF